MYVGKPSDLLVACLRSVPLILRSVGDCFQLVIDLPSQLSFIMSIPKFLLVVNAIYIFALGSHLHEEVRVIIGFLSVKGRIGRSIDLELFIDFLMHSLLD